MILTFTTVLLATVGLVAAWVLWSPWILLAALGIGALGIIALWIALGDDYNDVPHYR